MRKALLTLGLLVGGLLVMGLTTLPPAVPYHFWWEQNTNDLTPDLSWNIYSNVDVTASLFSYGLYTNIAYTNLTATNATDPSSKRFYLPFTAPSNPKVFYYITASNAFMQVESAPSPITNTPSLTNPALRLTR